MVWLSEFLDILPGGSAHQGAQKQKLQDLLKVLFLKRPRVTSAVFC